MNVEPTERDFTDNDMAVMVEGIAREFRHGEKSRAEFRDDLLALLAGEPEIVVRERPIRTDGRFSFGRSYEGREGVGIFVPAESLAE